LLVVIGIIALLISILLPSLTRARDSANLLAGQSNFRQIYMALALYAGENKDMLPVASVQNANSWTGSGTNGTIFVALNKYVGTPMDFAPNDTKGKLSPIFTSVNALDNTSGIVWAPGMTRTVFFNQRAFPGYDQDRATFPQRKLSGITNASGKIAAWEGPQLPTWNMSSEPECIAMEGWRSSGTGWGHRFADPVPDDAGWDQSHVDNDVVDGMANRDEVWWTCGIRYRFLKNTTTPVIFFDGHSETRTKKTFKVKELCLNVKK